MSQPKQELQASLANLDKHITATVHTRLSNIHTNDVSLTKQTKTLQSRTHEARKQQDTWDTVVRAGRNGMKELGDAGNWASLLDKEITFLESVIQQTEQ